MKHGLVCLFVLVGVVSAVAQVQVKPAGPPRPAVPQPTGPQGEQKLRWVCRQLRLDPTQMQQAEALILEYHAVTKELEENAAELLQKIQDKFAEIQAAKSAGESDKVKRLQDELRNMAPAAQAENRFFEGLEQFLKPEQKERLPEVRKQAETAGDISLRPIHVIRVLKDFPLTVEQQGKLEKIMTDFRLAQASAPPPGKAETKPADAQDQRLEQLVTDIRSILLPEQLEQFDRKLEEVRLAPPPVKPIVVPGASTQPGTAPAAPPPRRPPPPPPPGQPRP